MTQVQEEIKIQLKEPKKYLVLLHNDDFTTMDFVTDVLTQFFAKSYDQAIAVMLEVHHKGYGVAGIYSAEIAETKVEQVTGYAREHGFPLKLTVEPET